MLPQRWCGVIVDGNGALAAAVRALHVQLAKEDAGEGESVVAVDRRHVAALGGLAQRLLRESELTKAMGAYGFHGALLNTAALHKGAGWAWSYTLNR